MPATLLFGAIAAIVVGLYLVSTVEELEGDPTILDKVGDWFAEMTTSEETRVSQLESETQAKVRELIARLESEDGIKVHAGQTLRTAAQERANVEAGKTSAGLTVSWHQLGRAIDLYPMLDGITDYAARALDQYRKLHSRAVDMGFRSLAFNADGSKRLITNSKGKKIWDGGHIEWRGSYATIAQAVAAEGSNYDIG